MLRAAAHSLLNRTMDAPFVLVWRRRGAQSHACARGLATPAPHRVVRMGANAFEDARPACREVGMNDVQTRPAQPESLLQGTARQAGLR